MEKRGNTYMGVVYHPTLVKGRARRSFKTEREAKAWEMDSKARLMRGEPLDMGEAAARRSDGRPYTLQELRDYTVQTHWKEMRGAKTAMINSQSIVDTIGPNFPFAKVTHAEIAKARQKLLDGGNSTTTVNKKVSCLHTMLKTAAKEELLPHLPQFPKPFEEREGKQSRFTPEWEARVQRYFELIGQELMADYALFSLDTGLRQGEVLRLTAAEYDGKNVTCWGEWTKSGKTRIVPLTARAKAIVERRKEAEGDRLFPLTKDSINHYWTRFRADVGKLDDDDFTPHLLRHEFCSRLADRGVAAPTIMTLAGHSQMQTSQRYVRVNAASLEAAIQTGEPSASVTATPLASLLAQLQALGVIKEGVDLSKLEGVL